MNCPVSYIISLQGRVDLKTFVHMRKGHGTIYVQFKEVTTNNSVIVYVITIQS